MPVAARRLSGRGRDSTFPRMEASAAVQCPYCGQTFELVVDTSAGSQRFVTDCEICCRPIEVAAECQPGEIVSLDVLGG